MERWTKYFSDHPWYNSTVHWLGGAGVALLVYSFLTPYQTILGWILVAIAVLGHVWAWINR